MSKQFEMPKVIAHRGASAYAPENTIASFEKAAAMGAKWVEFDVMLTEDNVLIVIHDDTLDRTTSGSGPVAETAYSTIQALDAGSWFNPKYNTQRVSTLVELLPVLRNLGLNINVELKALPGREEATARATIEQLREHWPCDTNPPYLSSWNLQACQAAAKLAPELIVGSVVHMLPEIDTAIDSRLVGVNHEILNPETFAQLKERFEFVFSYTVNDQALANELFELGVDAVFSDYPDLLD